MIEDTQKIIDDYIFNSEYFSNEFESYLKSNNDLSNYLIKAVYKSLDQKNANALCFGLEAIFLHGNIDIAPLRDLLTNTYLCEKRSYVH